MAIAGLAPDITIKSIEGTRSSLTYCTANMLTLLAGGLITLPCIALAGIPALLDYLDMCFGDGRRRAPSMVRMHRGRQIKGLLAEGKLKPAG